MSTQSEYRLNTNLNGCCMLLSYDPDIINMFKIILNTIFTNNYKKNKKNVNVFKKLINAIL